MKEVFRDRDITRCTIVRDLLEAEDIKVIIRNELLATSGLTEIPIPEFFPNVCVLYDGDFEKAQALVKNHLSDEGERAKQADKLWVCRDCGESVPGSFDWCYACEAPRKD